MQAQSNTMGYDIVMAYGILLMATKQKQMEPYKNIKIEDVIKRDDFISVTNESHDNPELHAGLHHSFYKVKMKSKRKLVGCASSTMSNIHARWIYTDMFGKEVQHPEYYFFISKANNNHAVFISEEGYPVCDGQEYWYVNPNNFNVSKNIASDYHKAPNEYGKRFATKKAADMYIYNNKKVATQAEVDKKTIAAYENGKEVERTYVNINKVIERQKIEASYRDGMESLKYNFKIGIDPYRS